MPQSKGWACAGLRDRRDPLETTNGFRGGLRRVHRVRKPETPANQRASRPATDRRSSWTSPISASIPCDAAYRGATPGGWHRPAGRLARRRRIANRSSISRMRQGPVRNAQMLLVEPSGRAARPVGAGSIGTREAQDSPQNAAGGDADRHRCHRRSIEVCGRPAGDRALRRAWGV